MYIFKLAVMSLEKKVLMVIMIVLELSALFFAGNYTVCALNERTMLSDPYKSILNKNSILFFDTNFPTKAINNEVQNQKESQNKVLEKLEGNFTVYNFLSYNQIQYSDYIVISVADDLYNSLKLPLSSGNYGKDANSAVASIGIKKGYFDINTPEGSFTLNICGNLTQNTFLPSFHSFKNDLCCSDLYTSTNGKNIIITGRSAVEDYEQYFDCTLGFIVKFASAADAEKNIEMLRNEGSVMNGTKAVTNTNTELFEDLKSYLPILCCIFLIVVIGLVCISTIIFDESKYRSGVLWICGYSKKKIAAIQAASISVLLVLSLTVFAALSIILNILATGGVLDTDTFIKLNFSLTNFIFTLTACAVLILISAAIPFIRLFKKSPIEYLGRAK